LLAYTTHAAGPCQSFFPRLFLIPLRVDHVFRPGAHHTGRGNALAARRQGHDRQADDPL